MCGRHEKMQGRSLDILAKRLHQGFMKRERARLVAPACLVKENLGWALVGITGGVCVVGICPVLTREC